MSWGSSLMKEFVSMIHSHSFIKDSNLIVSHAGGVFKIWTDRSCHFDRKKQLIHHGLPPPPWESMSIETYIPPFWNPKYTSHNAQIIMSTIVALKNTRFVIKPCFKQWRNFKFRVLDSQDLNNGPKSPTSIWFEHGPLLGQRKHEWHRISFAKTWIHYYHTHK